MEAKDIKLKIRYLIDKALDIEISPSETVLGLKGVIYALLGVESKDQKLIYRGSIYSS
jgi:hypothetical protein